MQSIPPPKLIKVYQLIKMSTKTGLTFNPVGNHPPPSYIGTGFYKTLDDAEHNRTLEALKGSEGDTFHVFELEFPNPLYRGD